MGKAYAGLMAAMAASAAISHQNSVAFADGPFNFLPFGSSPPAPAPAPGAPPRGQPQPKESGDPAVRAATMNDSPRTSSAGFNPEALERGAKALREITSSSHAKKVFELLKTQETTRQSELAEKVAEFKATQARAETEKQRVLNDEQKKLAQDQAQIKSQMLRYEDELARKRMQADNEYQRARNKELVKLQEESSIRQEQARRATEEQIQAQRRQTERQRAEIERETIRVKAMAEAEGRAHEAKLSEEVNRRMWFSSNFNRSK